MILGSASLLARQSQWQHTEVTDPDSGKPAERFVLEGSYIETPQSLTNADVPSLVLICSEGRIVRQYGIVRTILWNGGVRMEYVVDGGRKKSATGEVMASRDPRVTADSAHRTFSTFDLHNILPDLLRGKTIRIAVQDDYGANYRGSPPQPQVLVEFHIPDPALIVSRCGVKL